MKVRFTRDSVCAGDDCDAPHVKEMGIDAVTIEEVLLQVMRSGYLAQIAGGRATWSAASKIPLAIVAQEWVRPRMLLGPSIIEESLNIQYGVVHIHFHYHGQEGPEVVYEKLRVPGVRLLLPKTGGSSGLLIFSPAFLAGHALWSISRQVGRAFQDLKQRILWR